MGRIYGVALGLGLCCSVLSYSAGADNLWRISSPYPGNPLKVAVLDGVGQASGQGFSTTLELSCHPGAAVPRIVLRVPAVVAGWDFSAYEGAAGGTGQRRRTLTVLVKGDRVLDRPHFSGISGDHSSFMFSWQPSEALLARLVQPGDWISIHLGGIRRSQGVLDTHFDFPVDAAAMREALAPCSATIARKDASR